MISPEAIADMHIHSCASDGSDTPEEIIEKLINLDIGIASLTDHNNISNTGLFLDLAEKNGITAIPGVEISTKIGKTVYHIIAYGFDPSNPRISEYVSPLFSMMRGVGERIIGKMSSDYPDINPAEFNEYVHDRSLGGWKFVHYLYDKGIVEKPIDALSFREIYDCHFYECDYPHPADAIKEIHSWGAYPILAHPNYYFIEEFPSADSITSLFDKFKSYGLAGIECHYPSHNKEMTNISAEWCKANDMMITAGCDSHGSFVPGRGIGTIRIPYSKLRIEPLIGG